MAFTPDFSGEYVVIAEQTVSSAIVLKKHLDNNSVLSTQALEAYNYGTYDYGIAVCSLNFEPPLSQQYICSVSLELDLDSKGIAILDVSLLFKVNKVR